MSDDTAASGPGSDDARPAPAPAPAVEAVLDAAPTSGAELRVAEHHDGYTVSVAGTTRGRLTREAAADLLREHPEPVTNWRYWRDVGGQDTPRRAFLRWLEGAEDTSVADRYVALADGVSRTWGQLLVTARLAGDGSGDRRYELRHVRDRGRDRAALALHERPRAAREIATYDERDRYRPLKTAPTLRRGWAFPDLDGDALVRTVDAFYPATVANWHRERSGDLDVTHFRETAERQTGIYGVVGELDPENVAHLAAACCADSQCLRRREWDESAEEPLGVPPGEAEFPCREPCSLVVAAARTFATHQDEEPREYTFELTPTEKNQLEAILDAVADGRVDDIREADLGDPANRYRARFLRSKRLTERGLSDVPTFEE
ncbi:MAG: DR2241 family protein [Halobacteriaceae archaeon]